MSDGREILVGFMWWIVWCFSGVDYVMYSGVYSRMASEMASGMASETMTTTMTTKPEHLYLPNYCRTFPTQVRKRLVTATIRAHNCNDLHGLWKDSVRILSWIKNILHRIYRFCEDSV